VRTPVALEARDMTQHWMLDRLALATATHHAAVDEYRLALITPTVTAAAYRAFLVRSYAQEAPIEASFTLTTELDDVIDLRGRMRVKLLKNDLRAVGIPDPGRICVSRRARPFRSIPEALGWVYVLERASRINGVVRRHLERKLPELTRVAGMYLQSERGAGSRWSELGHILDQVATNDQTSDEIVAAAHAAFRYQTYTQREEPPQMVRVA
jgi:heme oxygenase